MTTLFSVFDEASNKCVLHQGNLPFKKSWWTCMKLTAVSKPGRAATASSSPGPPPPPPPPESRPELGGRGDNTASLTGSSELCCRKQGPFALPFVAILTTFWRILRGSDTLRLRPIELDLLWLLALDLDLENNPLVIPSAPLPPKSVLAECRASGGERTAAAVVTLRAWRGRVLGWGSMGQNWYQSLGDRLPFVRRDGVFVRAGGLGSAFALVLLVQAWLGRGVSPEVTTDLPGRIPAGDGTRGMARLRAGDRKLRSRGMRGMRLLSGRRGDAGVSSLRTLLHDPRGGEQLGRLGRLTVPLVLATSDWPANRLSLSPASLSLPTSGDRGVPMVSPQRQSAVQLPLLCEPDSECTNV